MRTAQVFKNNQLLTTLVDCDVFVDAEFGTINTITKRGEARFFDIDDWDEVFIKNE